MPAERFMGLVEQYLDDAEAAARVGDWDLVISKLDDILVLDRDNADAYALRLVAERHLLRAPAADRRRETVLFADIVDSTQWVRTLGPERWRHVLRRYDLACIPPINALGGYVHRFLGDGVLATFGFPQAHEDDARRAVQAGLDILESVAAANTSSGIELQLRIGLASGEVVHDDRGSGIQGHRNDLIGDAVNLAARLQAVAMPGQVYVNRLVAILVAGFYDLAPVGLLELKGFGDVEVHRVVRRTTATGWVNRSGLPASPFIGRQDVFNELLGRWAEIGEKSRSALDPVDQGLGTAVLITGEPGVGKSRLVYELIESTSTPDRVLLEVQCSAHRTASPLYPVRAAIEHYSDVEPTDDDSTRLAKLETVLRGTGLDTEALPYLAQLLDLGALGDLVRPELTPIQLREMTLGHLQGWIGAIAATSPCLLVIEDVHWADPSTLELIRRVMASPPSRLLGVVTSRRRPNWAQDVGFHALDIAPLSPDETRAMARALAVDRFSAQLVEEIVRRSDGIPLYVEQLADALARSEDSAVTRRTSIPVSLSELLQARLDAAGPSKRVAQLASTIGREFEADLVEAMARQLEGEGKLEVHDRSVRDHLDRLVESGLVVRDREDGRRLRFRHALVGEAAYESQLLEERPERHEVLARLLVDGGTTGRPADPAVVAQHFDAAGRPEDAVAHYLLAAAQGHANGAFAEVRYHLEAAEGLLPDVAEATRVSLELAIRLARGTSVMAVGGYAAPGVREDFERSVALCESLRGATDIGPSVIKALLGVWMYYCATGDLARARTVSDALERQLWTANLPGARPSFHADRGVEHFFAGEVVEAAEHLQRAVELFADDDIDPAEWPLSNDPLSAVYAFLGPVRLIRGDEAGALIAVATGLERCRDLEFPRGPVSVAFVRNWEAWMHRARGDFEDAAFAAEELLRIGERHGFFDWLMTGRIHSAAAAAASQPSLASLDAMGEAMSIWRAVGGEVLLPSLLVEQGWGYLAIGEVRRAECCLADAEEIIGRGQRLGAAEAHRLRAEVTALIEGPADPAVGVHLRTGMGVAISQGASLYVLRSAASFARWIGLDELDDQLRQQVNSAVQAYGPHSRIPQIVFGDVMGSMSRVAD